MSEYPRTKIMKLIHNGDMEKFIDVLSSGKIFDDATAIEYYYNPETVVIENIKNVGRDYLRIHVSFVWSAKYDLPPYYLNRDFQKQMGLGKFHVINNK